MKAVLRIILIPIILGSVACGITLCCDTRESPNDEIHALPGSSNKYWSFEDTLLISQLLQDLKNDPSPKSIDFAFLLLSKKPKTHIPEKIETESLKSQLQLLLRQHETRNLVLNKLSEISDLSFDFVLSELLHQGLRSENVQPNIDLLLSAVSSSGGIACADSLHALVSTPSEKIAYERPKLIQTLNTLDPNYAIRTMLNFYITIPGRWEINNIPGTAETIVKLLENLNSNHDQLILNLQQIAIFLGSDGSDPGPIKIMHSGIPTSPQNRIHRKILSILKRSSSPTSLSIAMSFLNSDDPEIVSQARQIDYSIIKSAPWLLPEWSFPFKLLKKANRSFNTIGPYTKEQESEFAKMHPAWPIVESLKDKIGARYSPPFGFPDKHDDAVAFGKSLLIEIHNSYKINVDTSLTVVGTNFNNKYLNPWLPNYLSQIIDETHKITTKALITQHKTNVKQANDLARAIINSCLQRRILVLYAILKAKNKKSTFSAPVHLSTIDEYLDTISKLGLKSSPTQIKTEIVDYLDIKNYSNHKYADICDSVKFNLLARRISINQAAYEELLLVQCDSKVDTIEWYGRIPGSLIQPLIRHPRLLDFIGYSLSIRDISLTQYHKGLMLTDLDYLRDNPYKGLSLLISALHQPELPWRHYKDKLLADFRFNFLTVFSPELNDVMDIPPTKIDPFDETKFHMKWYPFGTITRSSAEFDSIKQILLSPLFELVKAKTNRLYVEKYWPHVYNLPKEVTKPGIPSFLSWVWGAKTINQERVGALNLLQKDYDTAYIAEKYYRDWDLSDFSVTALERALLRQFILTHDLKQYIAVYELQSQENQSRFFPLVGRFDSLPTTLENILSSNPDFLARYWLDLPNSSENSSERVSVAVNRYLHNQGFSFSTTISELTDTNKPNLYYTIEELDLFATASNFSDSIPLHPLYQSNAGKILAAQLNEISKIRSFMIGKKLPQPGQPKPHFVSAVKQRQHFVDSIANKVSLIEAKKRIDEINKKKKEFSISFSISLDPSNTSSSSPPNYQGSFSYNKFSVGISTSFDGFFLLSPNYDDNIFIPSLIIKIPSNNQQKYLSSNEIQLSNVSNRELNNILTNIQYKGQLTARYLAGSINLSKLDNYSYSPLASANIPQIQFKRAMPVIVSTSEQDSKSIISLEWSSLPSLPDSWMNKGGQQIDRRFIYRMVLEALPKFNEDEKTMLLRSFEQKTFNDDMLDIISKRRAEAYEESQIQARQWIKTYSDPNYQILPSYDKNPCPLPGCLNDSPEQTYQLWDQQIIEFNERAGQRFLEEIDSLKQKFKTEKLFVDGLPATYTLRYGNDFQLMQFQVDYLLVNGEHLTHEYINKTPFWLIDHVKKDPNGHVLEKLWAAGSMQLLQNINDPVAGLLLKSLPNKKQFVDKWSPILNQTIDLSIPKPETTVIKWMEGIAKEFIIGFRLWGQSKPHSLGTEDPFMVPPDAIPFLNLLPPPYEWHIRMDENLSEILLYQYQSKFIHNIKSRTTKLYHQNPQIE